jgi:hypothetical protein
MNSFNFMCNHSTNSGFSDLSFNFSDTPQSNLDPINFNGFLAQPSSTSVAGTFPIPPVVSLNESKFNELKKKYDGTIIKVHQLTKMVLNLLNDKNFLMNDKNQLPFWDNKLVSVNYLYHSVVSTTGWVSIDGL